MAGQHDDDTTVVCKGGCRRALHSVTSRYIGMGPKCLERALAGSRPAAKRETPGQLPLFTVEAAPE